MKIITNKNKSLSKKKNYHNFFLSILFFITFLLILFNKTDYYLVNTLKSFGIDFINPVTRFVSSPVTVINNVTMRLKNIQNLELENLKLKEEIIRLKKWQTLAIKNSRENRVFKRLLNSTSHQIDIIKTASVINQSPGIYTNIITINAGLNSGVDKNFAVINSQGLVGKTIFSSKHHTKILLINNTSSAIPVKALSDGSFSILNGASNGKHLISSFSKNNNLPRVGDLLVTSGNAKIFPRDILVAKVIAVKEDHYIALPYVDFNNLNYIQVVKSK